MSILQEVKKLAQQIATDAEHRVTKLEVDKVRLQAQMAQIEAESQKLRGSAKRFSKFRAEIDGAAQCPRCWINDGVISGLRNIEGDTKTDRARCPVCHLPVSSEA